AATRAAPATPAARVGATRDRAAACRSEIGRTWEHSGRRWTSIDHPRLASGCQLIGGGRSGEKSRQGAKTPRAPRRQRNNQEEESRRGDPLLLSLPSFFLLLGVLGVLASWRLCCFLSTLRSATPRVRKMPCVGQSPKARTEMRHDHPPAPAHRLEGPRSPLPTDQGRPPAHPVQPG